MQAVSVSSKYLAYSNSWQRSITQIATKETQQQQRSSLKLVKLMRYF